MELIPPVTDIEELVSFAKDILVDSGACGASSLLHLSQIIGIGLMVTAKASVPHTTHFLNLAASILVTFLAETDGFEPSRAFRPCLVSSEVLSTTQPRLQWAQSTIFLRFFLMK